MYEYSVLCALDTTVIHSLSGKTGDKAVPQAYRG